MCVRAALCIASVGWSALLVGGSAGAQAPDPALELTWQASARCPDQTAMRARIVEAAGGPGAAVGRARARAERAGGQWVVELDAGDGPRILRGDSCDQVARAAALVIGIALRARRTRAPTEGGQVGDDEVPWREPRAEQTVARTLARTRPARWQPAILIRAGAMSGALPDLAPMVRAGVSARAGSLAARVDATFATTRYGQLLEGETEAQMRVHLVAATGSGCYVASWLWMCGGFEVGALEAAASAADARVSGAGLWVAGHAGPSAVLALSRAVDMVLETEAAVPLAYPRFLVNGIAQPGPEPVSIRASLGLRMPIP